MKYRKKKKSTIESHYHGTHPSLNTTLTNFSVRKKEEACIINQQVSESSQKKWRNKGCLVQGKKKILIRIPDK